MKYERFTKRGTDNNVILMCNNCPNNYICPKDEEELVLCVQSAKEKVAEFEDKLENGTLIELPCKVGKILYEVCEKPNDNLFVKLPSEFFIVEHRVCDIKIRMIGKKPIFAIFTSNKEFGVMTWAGEDIGSQLFLTKAEAEKKLKELIGKDETNE